MTELAVEQASTRLPELVDQAASGEEVLLRRKDGAMFRIVQVASARPQPRYGSARGLIEIREDFDDPIPGFESYQP